MRKLSLTRYRYRFLDAHGQVITGRSIDDAQVGPQVDSQVDVSLSTNPSTNQATNPTTNEPTHHFRDNPIAETIDSTRIFPIESVEPTYADNNDAIHAGTINQTSGNTADSAPAHTDHYSTARCSEAIPNYYCRKKTPNHAQGNAHNHAQAFTHETPPSYGMTA